MMRFSKLSVVAATTLATSTAAIAVGTTHSLAAGAVNSVTSVSGSAYGESVDVTSLLGAHVVSGPLPTVTLPSTGGGPVTNSLATVTVPNLLSAGLLQVSTQGATGASGSAQSNAATANVRVGSALTPILTASVVTSQCSASGTGATGSAAVVNLGIAGHSVINGALPANTTIPLIGIGKIVLNEQIISSSATDASITVNAIHVILSGLVGNGDIIISQSHCDVTLAPLAAQFSTYVGYVDNYTNPPSGTPDTFFPSPWNGGSNVTFVGQPATDSSGAACNQSKRKCWEAGAVRVDNTGTSAVTVHVSVDIGSFHYDVWGSGDQTVPAGGTLILTQNGPGGQGSVPLADFDTSDSQGCTASGQIPVVHVTVNGTTTSFNDTKQVLDTGGIDPNNSCPSGGNVNEGHGWVKVG